MCETMGHERIQSTLLDRLIISDQLLNDSHICINRTIYFSVLGTHPDLSEWGTGWIGQCFLFPWLLKISVWNDLQKKFCVYSHAYCISVFPYVPVGNICSHLLLIGCGLDVEAQSCSSQVSAGLQDLGTHDKEKWSLKENVDFLIKENYKITPEQMNR